MCAALSVFTGLGVASSHAASAGGGFPIVTRYAPPEVINGRQILRAVQGPDGVMQFGARDLLSFDGERWRVTPLNSGHDVRGLDFGGDGRLWVGATGEVGWCEPGPSGWIYHSLLSMLPAKDANLGDVWHVFAQGEGAVFVTADKILRWEGKAFTAWPMTGERHLRAFRVNGEILIQHSTTGLYRLTERGPEPFLPASVLGEAAVLLLERSGETWTMVNSTGILRGNAAGFRLVEGPLADFAAKAKLISAVRLPDGRVAASSMKGLAIATAEGGIDALLDGSSGLGESYISSVSVDRQGSLWATTNSAIFRLSLASASTLFDRRSGLGPQEVKQITQHDGAIVLLTNDAIYQLSGDSRQVSRLGAPGLFHEVQSSSAGLLIAGFHQLARWDGRTSRVLRETKNDIMSVVATRTGRSLFLDHRDLHELLPTGETRLLTAGLPDFAASLAEDAEGNIWIGTESGGVLKLQSAAGAPGVALPVTGVTPGPGTVFVVSAPDGSILVFGRNGAWRHQPAGDVFVPLTPFPAHETIAIAPRFDRHGRLWLATHSRENGIISVGYVTLGGNQAGWTPHSIEGLVELGAPRCIYPEDLPDGSVALWIGGTTHVLRNAVTSGAFAPVPAVPLLHAYAHSKEGTRWLTSPLPYSTSSIRFEFAAPDFVRRNMLRLETRLDGTDRTWMPVGPDAQREFTALREGHYLLQARAVAETGATSEITTFAFSVAPPWWRTLPAFVGVALALAPAAYGVYRLRLRTLRRRNLELEAKVRQRTAQLEQANAAKTQFVANMSHDIRNPLNGIVGLALALEDTRLDSQQREIVATMRECTTYLSTLVDDVLDFASIEAGRVELRPGPFVPAELLRSIVTAMKADTAESGARLIVDVDPALPANISGDAGRIQQIVVNYVSNALKYAGGAVHLTATIPISSPDEVEFAVSDAGPGISAAEQATLFTKFTRLASAREHEIPGAGLGLASCRLLADLMGGSVGVESQPGHGARFFLRLPLTAAVAPAVPVDGELPNTTVLLVEDTDYNALAATAVLRRLGLSCERARTGAEALELFTAKRYNLVLLDRNLPDLDGLEIARRMRQLESTDGLRSIILAVTAYCTADDRQLCLDAGMDAFVGKPLTPEKLRRVLLAAGRRMLTAATLDAAPERIVTPTATSTPVDMSLLNYLSDGTPAGLESQVERFLTSLAEAEALLTQAAKAEDYPELATGAHRVLGQARMVGAAALTKIAAELELVARAADAAQCAELRQRVAAEIRSLTAALRRRRSGALTS